jgi:hypothetical protein
LLTFAHLLANQSANYRRQSCRPEGGPHRRVTTRRAPSNKLMAQGSLSAHDLSLPRCRRPQIPRSITRC